MSFITAIIAFKGENHSPKLQSTRGGGGAFSSVLLIWNLHHHRCFLAVNKPIKGVITDPRPGQPLVGVHSERYVVGTRACMTVNPLKSELGGHSVLGCSFALLVEKRAKRFSSSQRLTLTRQAKVRPARAALQEAPLQQHGCRSV